MLGKRAFLVVLALVFLASLMLFASQARADACPPGSLVINSTGTFICPVPAEDLSMAYTSLVLLQNGSSFTFAVTCLTSGGCNYNITVYDYYNGSLIAIDNVQRSVGAGESLSKTYTVSGTGIIELSANNVYYGYYFYPASQPSQVAITLNDLAGSNLFVEIMVALIIVSVPIGWALMREVGLAGLALTAMSIPIYTLVSVLTSNPPVALLVSVVASFIGIVYLIISKGEVS
jgi:hypothetical protein